MQIRKRTPRTEMEFDVIASKMGDHMRDIASELDAQEFYVDRVMTQFVRLSNRVVFEEGEVDFEIASPDDPPAVICGKFDRYLDSEHLDKIEEALTLILETDMPHDPVTAPTPPVGDQKKS